MYVADVTDIKELEYLLGQAKDDLKHAVGGREIERAAWDIEDITNRIKEIS